MPDSDIQAKQMEISRTVLICVVLAAATFVAFEGVRTNDFVHYDDDKYVTSNEYVQKGLSFESIRWAFTTWHQGNWHPLTWMSHLIDSSVFGMNPAGHHLVSVGFHIANVILLFLILKKMTGAIWPSAFVAAVFGLHPLGGGIGRVGCRAKKCPEQLFRVFDDMGVFVVCAKAGMAAIRGDCDSFRGGIAFQVDAGDAAVCFDSAGLLADGQVRRTEGVAMALAGDCR